MTKVKTLTCTVCGGSTHGRQWYNRDIGFGICGSCVKWLRERSTPEHEIVIVRSISIWRTRANSLSAIRDQLIDQLHDM